MELINIEREKFLNELLGKCWHEWKEIGRWDGIERGYIDVCTKCGLEEHTLKMYGAEVIDFSTWEGFGKLWVFIKKQNWYINFVFKILWSGYSPYPSSIMDIPDKYINPNELANAVFKYFREEHVNG